MTMREMYRAWRADGADWLTAAGLAFINWAFAADVDGGGSSGSFPDR